jgi:hypothetical protein
LARLDEHASEVLASHNSARVLSIELQRLDQLNQIFHRQVVETRDPASGTLWVKIQWRSHMGPGRARGCDRDRR